MLLQCTMTGTAVVDGNKDPLQHALSTAAIPLDNDVVESAATDLVKTTPLSKNATKKQLKHERMVQKRKLKKQLVRDERRKQALIDGRNITAEQALVAVRTLSGDGWKRRQLLWEQEKIPLIRKSFHICIDCSYENLMTPKEIASLAAQIRCCYAYNKRNPCPCQMVVTDLSSSKSPLTLQSLQKETGYDEWSNRAYISTALRLEEYYRSGNYIEPCHISHIVYLTSDSDHTLTSLENDTVYVIGGIVDRNRCKGVAYSRATTMMSSGDGGISISTAKLPLSEYIQHMPSTPVLTINHVLDILLQYRNHNHDWNTAFRNVLPQRKEAHFIEECFATGIL
jgi:tRNA (guanine9-N1)-methyltransferase